MRDHVPELLESPPGTTLWGLAKPAGDGDVTPYYAFFVKVGRGEAHGSTMGPKPIVRSTASVIRGGPDKKVAVVPFVFRMGDYPRAFLAWFNHYDPEMPSPLETLRTMPRYRIHVYENKPTPKRVIQTGNNQRFWDALLVHVRQFARWSPEDFTIAAAETMNRLGNTPEDAYRTLNGQADKIR
jgi:hypothetical protein